ncbi:MAG TPA: serine/threonine-protein kinase, partial [Polyangiaceae bacterium]|nr:serine/threonine-protein kinase [Polyangiaceae bacterium]
LVAFASRFGRQEILSIMASVIHPENLGVWTRVLRGADTPETAFAQLGNYGGDAGPTERWTTLGATEDSWTGRVLGLRASELDKDGLLALARMAELMSIPMLFGFGPGKVTELSNPKRESMDFRVTWSRRKPVFLPAAAVASGGAALGVGWLAAWPFPELGIGTAAGAVVGAGIGHWLNQQRRRGTTVAAQLIRIQALERAASLRDARQAGSHHFASGSVVVGQYRLGEKLGAGASGSIWEAERIADGTIVAIKLLRTAVAHDTVAADRLRREAAALGLAWHPNVVEVYEDGILPDGTSYLVMERLYGESLAKRLRRDGPLRPHELLPIALQVCDALGAVHAAGVVHRDLKPSNIFLAKDQLQDDLAESPVRLSLSIAPPHERVKLLDFGVAQVEWAETRLTNTGAPLGTPGYMSPEQEQGIEIDHRSDIFALGGVIYECLTGSPPPLSADQYGGHYQSGRAESGVQRSLQELPEAWRQLVTKAMAFHPRDRHGDWRALRDALMALKDTSDGHTSDSQSR